MMKRIFRKRRVNRNALLLIALLLLASGAIRLSTGTGPALAREVEEMVASKESITEPEKPHQCDATEEISKVLDALGIRELAVKKREDALADRVAALNLAEQEIQRSLVELEAVEKDLADVLAIADTAAEDDLNRLTAVYENMKPKEAADIFEEMAPEFSAGFLGRMRPDAAASIMSGLSASKAYSISVILAGRNANVPTE